MKCKNCKNLINGWCEKKLDSPAPETERKCGDYEVKTHYDRIKSMSVEEMAAMLDNFRLDCSYCPAYDFCNESFKDEKCSDIVKKWLEQEVEENDR